MTSKAEALDKVNGDDDDDDDAMFGSGDDWIFRMTYEVASDSLARRLSVGSPIIVKSASVDGELRDPRDPLMLTF
jgi:hypothetical protein